MDIFYTANAHTQLNEWATEDKKGFAKLFKLIALTARSPYEGDGNPEPLKHNLVGYWSRRITSEHRLVYRVNEDETFVKIISCRGHYTDL